MTTKVMVCFAIAALASAGGLRAQQPFDAASQYAKACASCHGAKGTPNPAMARSMAGLPDLADARAMAAVSDSALRNAISAGKGRMMTAYKTRFTPEQINALVSYIRTFSRH